MEELQDYTSGRQKPDMQGLHLGDGVGVNRSILWHKVSKKVILSKACLSYCLCNHISLTGKLLKLYC